MSLSRYISLGLLATALLVGCNLSDLRSYEHIRPLNDAVEPMDKAAYVSYLDTAAIDDWEGIWLLMSTKGNCYVVLERVNDIMHGSFYTHRIRLWSGDYGANGLETGAIVGYLEQGVSDDMKQITLFDGYILPHRNYSAYVRMDDDCRYVIFGNARQKEERESEYNRMGMMRIYPRRSNEESDYKVRYL